MQEQLPNATTITKKDVEQRFGTDIKRLFSRKLKVALRNIADQITI